MAFTTRTGRTAAIGTGSMSTSIVLMLVSFLGLAAPVAVAVGFAVWLLWPEARVSMKELLPAALYFAVSVLGLQVIIRAGAACCYLVAFVGPQSNVRNHLRALAQSNTGRYAALAAGVGIVMLPVMKYPFGSARAFVIIGLTVALVSLDILTLRGLTKISRTSRAAPFYEGMNEDEKRIADRPWPTSSRPSFPDPKSVKVAADASRYERRAKDIAELHVWIGAGIILIFTAFVGTSLSASWEKPGPGTMITVYVVLGFAALGFWLQRRARSYRALADEFAARASDLEALAARSVNPAATAPSRWLKRLLRRRSEG
ncbi:hypothetical protein [Microbacterium sp. 2RAF4]|uniref:hypothetical protein n=1 Tax=Microbacterium sp. 2RAF4 TaxID=3232999 RepID=UPI003F9AC67C